MQGSSFKESTAAHSLVLFLNTLLFAAGAQACGLILYEANDLLVVT